MWRPSATGIRLGKSGEAASGRWHPTWAVIYLDFFCFVAHQPARGCAPAVHECTRCGLLYSTLSMVTHCCALVLHVTAPVGTTWMRAWSPQLASVPSSVPALAVGAVPVFPGPSGSPRSRHEAITRMPWVIPGGMFTRCSRAASLVAVTRMPRVVPPLGSTRGSRAVSLTALVWILSMHPGRGAPPRTSG